MLSAILAPSLVANPNIIPLSSELECRCTGMLIDDPAVGWGQKSVLHKHNGLLWPDEIFSELLGIIRLNPEYVQLIPIRSIHGMALHCETILLSQLLESFEIVREIRDGHVTLNFEKRVSFNCLIWLNCFDFIKLFYHFVFVNSLVLLRNVRISWLFPPVVSIKLKFNCLLDYFLFCNINIIPYLLWHIQFFNLLINKVSIKFGVLHRCEGPWPKIRVRARGGVCTVLKVFIEIYVRIKKSFECLKCYKCWFVLLSFNEHNVRIGICKVAILA